MRARPLLAMALLPCAASAQDVAVKPLLDARLRYENVDQDGIAREADGLTLRVRPGLQLSEGGWSALIEGEVTAAIDDRYNSGTNGKTQFPLIVDNGNGELNRAQIR